MDRRSLKLKLRIGGSPTPESSKLTRNAKKMTEEEQLNGSDDDLDDDGPDDGTENGADEGISTRTRHGNQADDNREKHKKSKKKKKKREKEKERHKHRHHKDKNDEDDSEPPLKKQALDSSPISSQNTLTVVLQYLVEQLIKKDTQNFFANPVTDAIAPGYSTIISQPMDFSTMKEKIANEDYSSIDQLTKDLGLICNNCMTYNQQDTIYYKAAKKLLHLGERMLSKEKLLLMRKELPVISSLTKEQLGFEFPNEDGGSSEGTENSIPEEPVDVEEKPMEIDLDVKFEAIPDDLTPEEVADQATKAAQEAADKLTQKKAECTLGFLRQRVDGTTTLNFLTGCEGKDPNMKEKPVSLGLLTGKLTHGTASLLNNRDDKRNMAKPVKPLNYGSYSSFCPSYDSTFANLTKKESEMVYSTYGNDTAVQFAESIMDFSRNCDTATYLVDQLLNLLTHQKHSRVQVAIEERKKSQEDEVKFSSSVNGYEMSDTEQSSQDDMDFNSLRDLSQIGIDTSFLSYFEGMEQKKKNMKLQLETNAQLLDDLSKTQNERLSRPLPPNLNSIAQPSNDEIHLSEKVREGLANVARQVPPGALAPVPIVRRALGITMVPVEGEHIEV